MQHGAQPLRADARLERAARSHSWEMLHAGVFFHGAFTARIRGAGVHSPRIGENLAWGVGRYSRANAIVRMWMASPGPPREPAPPRLPPRRCRRPARHLQRLPLKRDDHDRLRRALANTGKPLVPPGDPLLVGGGVVCGVSGAAPSRQGRTVLSSLRLPPGKARPSAATVSAARSSKAEIRWVRSGRAARRSSRGEARHARRGPRARAGRARAARARPG